MVYSTKYKLINEYIKKYLTPEDIEICSMNSNANIFIETEDAVNYCLYFNKGDGAITFAGDYYLVEELERMSAKNTIASVAEYLGVNEEIRIRDDYLCFYVKKLNFFKTNVIAIGNKDHVVCVPIGDEWNEYCLDDIIAGLNKFEEDRGFPDIKRIVVEIPNEMYINLPEKIQNMKYIGIN